MTDRQSPFIADEGPSIGQLVGDLGHAAAGLLRDEIALARREIADGLDGMRRGLMLVVGGAVLGLVGLFSLTLSVIEALARPLGLWQSALLVGVALAIAAAFTVLAGVKRLSPGQVQPRQTLETLRETKQWLKQIK